MSEFSRLTVRAIIDEVETICDFVEKTAQDGGLKSDAVYHCRLSVEEVCTNIVEHGYHESGGQQVIDVQCELQPQYLVITIIDDAPPFNPLSLPDPNPSTPLWERQGGGWGIYFVKKYMDRVSYRYEDGRNHLKIEKLR